MSWVRRLDAARTSPSCRANAADCGRPRWIATSDRARYASAGAGWTQQTDVPRELKRLVGELLGDGEPARPGLHSACDPSRCTRYDRVLRTGRIQRELQHAPGLGQVAGEQMRAPERAES